MKCKGIVFRGIKRRAQKSANGEIFSTTGYFLKEIFSSRVPRAWRARESPNRVKNLTTPSARIRTRREPRDVPRGSYANIRARCLERISRSNVAGTQLSRDVHITEHVSRGASWTFVDIIYRKMEEEGACDNQERVTI